MTELVRLESVVVERGGRVVLNEVTLALRARERVALVGPNGAGKTTLLRTVAGLDRPVAGVVHAFGVDRRDEASFREVRRRIGLVFQDPDDQLFCPTVLEDVAFGPLNLGWSEAASYDRAHETLARLRLDHLAEEVTYQLSSGQKRLVCLAGVLAMEPDVLLLDEPTNALDDANRTLLIEILSRLEAAMLIVSHDRGLIERLTARALLLRSGRIEPALMHRHPLPEAAAHIHGLDAEHEHDPAPP